MIYVLIFAWLPLTMAFMPNGSASGAADCIFWSLLLLAACVDICVTLAALGSIASREAIRQQYQARFDAALEAWDLAEAKECLRSEELYLYR